MVGRGSLSPAGLTCRSRLASLPRLHQTKAEIVEETRLCRWPNGLRLLPSELQPRATLTPADRDQTRPSRPGQRGEHWRPKNAGARLRRLQPVIASKGDGLWQTDGERPKRRMASGQRRLCAPAAARICGMRMPNVRGSSMTIVRPTAAELPARTPEEQR